MYARYNEEERKGDHSKRNQQTHLYIILPHWSPQWFVSCSKRLSSKRVSHGSDLLEYRVQRRSSSTVLGLCYSAIESPF